MSQSPAGHCAAIWTARLGYCRFSGWRFEGMRETIIAHFDANAEIAKLGSLADTTQHSFDVLRVNFPRSYFNVQNALPHTRNLNAIGFTALCPIRSESREHRPYRHPRPHCAI